MNQEELNAIRAKIAKLLRMQQSPNPNEAANAAQMVEKLCREHGLLVEAIDSDYDPDKDEVALAEINTGKAKLNREDVYLMDAVVTYFNGCLVTSRLKGMRTWKIFATKANHLQIGLYYEYLHECREQALKKAVLDRPSWENARSFNHSFRLGFADSVSARLREMANLRRHDLAQIAAAPGLVAMSRPQMELRLSEDLMNQCCPKITTARSAEVASFRGAQAGQAAGNAVGLNKQATGSSTRALGAGAPREFAAGGSTGTPGAGR